MAVNAISKISLSNSKGLRFKLISQSIFNLTQYISF